MSINELTEKAQNALLKAITTAASDSAQSGPDGALDYARAASELASALATLGHWSAGQ